jgi:hypothetical protein
MLDVDMTGTWCGAICIDHQDCRGVIFEQEWSDRVVGTQARGGSTKGI